MWILTTAKNPEYINSDTIIKLFYSCMEIKLIYKVDTVKCFTVNNDTIILGAYETRQAAQVVLKKLSNALSRKDESFEMKTNNSIEGTDLDSLKKHCDERHLRYCVREKYRFVDRILVPSEYKQF